MYEGEDTSKEPLFHLSLCSSLLKSKEKQTKEQILKTFYEHRVQYKDFIKDPSAFINDNNLVVKIDDSIYTWQLGIAILTCRFAYGEELSSALIDNMIKKQFTKSRWLTYFSGSNVSKLDITDNVSTKLALTADLNSSESNAVVKYRKVPDSDMLAKMNLVQGQNCARFVADTGGVPEEITLRIFLWEQDDKIVISDIDGTITKSDILGQIFSNYIH